MGHTTNTQIHKSPEIRLALMYNYINSFTFIEIIMYDRANAISENAR